MQGKRLRRVLFFDLKSDCVLVQTDRFQRIKDGFSLFSQDRVALCTIESLPVIKRRFWILGRMSNCFKKEELKSPVVALISTSLNVKGVNSDLADLGELYQQQHRH